MNVGQLTALINGLIALCQRHDILPTGSEELADELQSIASDEMYISKMEIETLF